MSKLAISSGLMFAVPFSAEFLVIWFCMWRLFVRAMVSDLEFVNLISEVAVNRQAY